MCRVKGLGMKWIRLVAIGVALNFGVSSASWVPLPATPSNGEFSILKTEGFDGVAVYSGGTNYLFYKFNSESFWRRYEGGFGFDLKRVHIIGEKLTFPRFGDREVVVDLRTLDMRNPLVVVDSEPSYESYPTLVAGNRNLKIGRFWDGKAQRLFVGRDTVLEDGYSTIAWIALTKLQVTGLSQIEVGGNRIFMLADTLKVDSVRTYVGDGLVASDDFGKSWKKVGPYVERFFVHGDTVIGALYDSDCLFVSINSGLSWDSSRAFEKIYPGEMSFDGGLLYTSLPRDPKQYVSSDLGVTWKEASTELTYSGGKYYKRDSGQLYSSNLSEGGDWVREPLGYSPGYPLEMRPFRDGFLAVEERRTLRFSAGEWKVVSTIDKGFQMLSEYLVVGSGYNVLRSKDAVVFDTVYKSSMPGNLLDIICDGGEKCATSSYESRKIIATKDAGKTWGEYAMPRLGWGDEIRCIPSGYIRIKDSGSTLICNAGGVAAFGLIGSEWSLLNEMPRDVGKAMPFATTHETPPSGVYVAGSTSNRLERHLYVGKNETQIYGNWADLGYWKYRDSVLGWAGSDFFVAWNDDWRIIPKHELPENSSRIVWCGLGGGYPDSALVASDNKGGYWYLQSQVASQFPITRPHSPLARVSGGYLLLDLEKAAKVRVEMVDASGRSQAVVSERWAEAGAHRIRLPASNRMRMVRILLDGVPSGVVKAGLQ